VTFGTEELRAAVAPSDTDFVQRQKDTRNARVIV